jgi:1,4-alpha-glucan branching enzyme
MVDFGGSGKVKFTFRCNTQRQVYVVGDFNGWDKTATPMHPAKDGLWYATVK